MLCRISEIKNVGTFTNCVSSYIPLDKFTLIYGRNTYGKSTLGDIFYSLEKDATEVVTARKSIPEPIDGSLQSIVMNFAAVGEKESDGVARFRGGVWQQGLRASHNLRTFNDAFYHDYVFSARKFTRDTKVNFSQFILGERGVSLANQIKDLNADKTKATRRRNTLLRDVFSSIEDFDAFLALPLPDSVDELYRQKATLEEEKHHLLAQRKGIDELRNRLELRPIHFDYQSLLSTIGEINELLATSLDSHHEEAKAKLQAHIEKNFAGTPGSEHWIQQGLKYGKGENCQFCAQALNDDALSLIESYKQYFNEEFDRHEAYITQELERLKPAFTPTTFQQLSKVIDGNLLTWDLYADLPGYSEVRDELTGISQSLATLIIDLEQGIDQLSRDLVERAEYKKQWPHKFLEELESQSFTAELETLNSLLADYTALVERINTTIGEFKAGLDDVHIQQRLAEINQEILDIDRSLDRVEKADACYELIELNTTLQHLGDEIPVLEERLSKEQSAYINNYFQSINRYFSKLGSHNFELERQSDRSGHSPVYYLKVKFHGQEVAESDLDKIFSESDRRALGLSVFMASLDAMDEQELSKTVVVFDDPVTSFDDHRVSATHRELVSLAKRCEQVILLSHYREGLAQFIKTYTFGNEHNVKLIELERDHQTSRFKVGNFDEFIRMAHEDNREKIIDFIECRSKTLPCQLRVYLELELGLRFGKQIREHNITNDNLSSRIDELVEKGVITAAIGEELDRWRKDLNPEHHLWVGNDIDDKRSTARSFFQFIYHALVPAS